MKVKFNMKKVTTLGGRILAAFSMLLLLATQATAQQSNTNQQYTLSTDDVLSVTVFNEPDLSLDKVRISENGTISVPLLGQVSIKGKTVPETEALLTELFLADYLKKPSVTVSVAEYRPFYINGEVKRPGSFPYRTGMTVQMAVTIAGGFSERASKTAIYLLPENSNAKPTKVSLTAEVNPGDVITVEESFF